MKEEVENSGILFRLTGKKELYSIMVVQLKIEEDGPMRKKILAPLLSLALCLSLLPTALAAGKTYEEAVKEFQEEDSMRTVSQTFESDYGTIFIYGSPNPHGATGSLRFITKAPCAKGEGEVIGLPNPRHSIMCATKDPQTAVLSEDGKTFTYTYHYDEPLTAPQGPMLRPAGDFIYTLDLTTGEVTEDVPAIPEDYNTYAAALERVKNEEGWVVEQTLEAPACTVLLRYFQAEDGQRSYFLNFVYKVESAYSSEGGVASHSLTITRDDGTGEAGFPVHYTHRAPDTLTLNEDKTLLTYTYSESLAGGADSETLELASGLSSKFNTLPTIEPQETQQPTTTEFTDVPSGSWFEKGVATCAEKGVMVGTGEGLFSPDTKLTVAECLALALRLYDLQRGGDGTMEKAPEDWGKLTLTLNDGTVFQGYGEVYQPFAWSDGEDGGLYVSCEDYGTTLWEEEVWGNAHLGPATVSLGGRDISGTIRMHMGNSHFLLCFDPDDPGDNEAIKSTYCEEAPTPPKWYRDAAYTVKTWGLRDDGHPGFSGLLEWSGSNLDHWADRKEFALALYDAAGKLEKKFSVDAIHDVYNGKSHFLTREKDGGIFALYEAGILGGINEFGTFGSHEDLTRAEAATMVARILDESQRLTKAPTPPNAYDQAVAELRNGFTYYAPSERTYETEDCTIFVYDRGGAMHTGPGNITIIYKPGSQLGAGTLISQESPNNWATLQTGADMLSLSENGKTFTYGYLLKNEVLDLAGMDTALPAGLYTYTVDLPTGTTTPSYVPLSYESSIRSLTYGRNYTLEKRLDGEGCTILLRWKPLAAREPDVKDYELWLIRKDETGSCSQLLLPSTVISEVYHYTPTDRSPDSLTLSEDGRALTYIYRFDEALENYHEAGTYTYTVDLSTGDLSVVHTEN
jgi:hypothetical protein